MIQEPTASLNANFNLQSELIKINPGGDFTLALFLIQGRAPNILQFWTWGRCTGTNDRKIGFLRAHRLETERQQAFKIVLGIPEAKARTVALGRSTAAQSPKSDILYHLSQKQLSIVSKLLNIIRIVSTRAFDY
ncbi:hypothetical protein [Tychonema sp. LEGE 07203]|uniref:hypothetical protein n=1 Tax=Tychonema sp. LEGE 07203 TaxID=1828671 RepID=UPI00187F0B46|nr:hypothetical protein [Tychonema sp. LEGE 07203]MBE9095459.1 hypothetical protein [Tychonema sp. LEGE 07203]